MNIESFRVPLTRRLVKLTDGRALDVFELETPLRKTWLLIDFNEQTPNLSEVRATRGDPDIDPDAAWGAGEAVSENTNFSALFDDPA